MNAKPLFNLILLAMTFSILEGADEYKAVEADEKIAALAVESREAIVVVTDGPWAGVGAFISADGLALIHLQAFMGKDEPQVTVAGEIRQKFGKILGIFPEQELALVKIDHRPKTWLKLAAEEPEIGDTVTLVTMKHRDMWSDKIPPIIGPIMAELSSLTANLREPQYCRCLSLGAGLSPAQSNALGPGCFAIDCDGKLVAFLSGRLRDREQTLIHLIPIVALAEKIASLSEEGIDLGHPLPPEQNPIDPASIDPDFHPLGMALNRRDVRQAKALLHGLEKRYPGSFVLKWKRTGLMASMNPQDGVPPLPKVDPEDPAAFQVRIHQVRAAIFRLQRKNDEALEELEAALKLSPPDFPEPRTALAMLHASQGRFDKAEKILQDLLPSCSDSIQFLDLLGQVLLDQAKLKEKLEIDDRISELRKIYRAPGS